MIYPSQLIQGGNPYHSQIAADPKYSGEVRPDTLSETLTRSRALLGQIEHTLSMIEARASERPVDRTEQAAPPEPDHINWKAQDIASRLGVLNERLTAHLSSL